MVTHRSTEAFATGYQSERWPAPFTVKWQYKVDGIARERIIEADQVNVAYDDRPPNNEAPTEAKLGVYTVPKSGLVVLGSPEIGADSMALAFGKVYVMNKDGRTVATYTLADPEGSGSQTAGATKTTAQLAREAGAN